MILRLACRMGTILSSLIFVASWGAYCPALAQSVSDRPATPAQTHANAPAESRGPQIWTCPIHTQIRQAESGNCPICAMELTHVGGNSADETPKLMGLQEMLAVALKHSPDVRAAEARVQAAEAELDRTRLNVVQQIMAFRDKWQMNNTACYTALEEVRAAEAAAATADAAILPQAQQLAKTTREKYLLARTRLAEVAAELPFLLGRSPGRAAEEDDKSRKLIRDELLPKARQILELRTREYTTGNASILAVAAAHRQVAEFESRLATTTQQKIAAVELQKQLLQNTRASTEQRYKADQASQGDLLTIDLELSKLDLWLLQLKGE